MTPPLPPPMRIALLPLDERPANTRYPAQIAAIANAQLVLPPASALPNLKEPAPRAWLADWLMNQAAECDGIVASLDLLGYGGLIASRTGDDDIATVLRAIEPLTTLRAPERPVFAFNVIQRISNADDATEEPEYWATYGRRLYRYSRELDVSGPRAISPSIPEDVVRDWLVRRARNHAVNLAMLREAASGRFDLLVIPSDDTAPLGLSARERKHLEFWHDILLPQDGRVLMYAGADDLGSAMVARMINKKRNHSPRVFVHYADVRMKDNVAPFEDRPIHQAVATQIAAVGARQTGSPDEADVILVVSPPFERAGDRDPHWRDHDARQRRAALRPTVMQIAGWLDEGRRVAVADVAFPNGAEPALVELLFEHTDVSRLVAFGGWNTAGNTLGTVLGAACVPGDDDRARQIALSHRLLEDWGYQSAVRDELRAWLHRTFGQAGIPHDQLPAATDFTAVQLHRLAARIEAAGLPCKPTRIRHPWRRTFEVDFDLA